LCNFVVSENTMIIVGTFTEISLRINTDKIRLSFFSLNDVYSVRQGNGNEIIELQRSSCRLDHQKLYRLDRKPATRFRMFLPLWGQ
jgi:hypothetical protein